MVQVCCVSFAGVIPKRMHQPRRTWIPPDKTHLDRDDDATGPRVHHERLHLQAHTLAALRCGIARRGDGRRGRQADVRPQPVGQAAGKGVCGRELHVERLAHLCLELFHRGESFLARRLGVLRARVDVLRESVRLTFLPAVRSTRSAYLQAAKLYATPIWSCRFTGKSGLTYDEALDAEEESNAYLAQVRYPSFATPDPHRPMQRAYRSPTTAVPAALRSVRRRGRAAQHAFAPRRSEGHRRDIR